MSTSNPPQHSLDQANGVLGAHFLRDRRNDYDHITCLIIYWEHDTEGFKEEAYQVHSFFTSKLNYPAELYEIPLLEERRSQMAVERRILEFKEALHRNNSLGIIHYGGHGDEDIIRDINGREPRKSVWAANPGSSSPKVRWSDIQPGLNTVNGHVLVILDCCFAAQAARTTDRVTPPNVELIASCAMRVKTALPGEHSFTTKFLKEAENRLEKKGYIVISDIYDSLSSRDGRLMQTPLRWGLHGPHSTIRLDPLSKLVPRSYNHDENSGSLSLRIWTWDPLDNSTLDKIIVWLKTHAPRGVAFVRIEEMTQKTSQLQKYMRRDGGGERSVAALHNLPEESQREVCGTWDMFKINLVSAVQNLTAGLSVNGGSEEVTDEIMVEFLVKFQRNLEALQRVVQRGVLSIPQLKKKEVLVSAIEDSALEGLDVMHVLRARREVNFPSDFPTLEKTPPITQAQATRDLSVPLVISEYGGVRVLVEYKLYERSDAHGIALCERGINRLAAVLHTSDPRSFHTPMCLTVSHEKKEARFALIFLCPRTDFSSVVSLRQVLEARTSESRSKTKTEKLRKPNLAERFSIARKMCKAVLQWHNAGWLHQGIASHNIVFLQAADGNIRYNEPLLCGFEFSRAENELSRDIHIHNPDVDVYKHPDRQGQSPKVRHTQIHDYYSLGLVLMEIGLWNCIPELLSSYIDRQGPAIVQEKLIKKMGNSLQHPMGEAYERATILCLKGEFVDGKKDTGISHEVIRRFEDDVLKRLEADPTREERKVNV